MLNVCFGESECGLIKCALRNQKTESSYMYLGYGAINPEDFMKSREKWFCKIYPGCSKMTLKRIAAKERQCFNRIMKIARREKELRVWCANNPNSRCGLYHLAYSLQGFDCKIFVVEMPAEVGFRDVGWDKGWAEADCEDVVNCLPLQREIDEVERNMYIRAWEKLVDENFELRVNIDGELASVAEDYLDNEILSRALVDKDIKLGHLVGVALGKSSHYMTAGFAESRIEAMVDKGIITVVKRDCDNNYNTILRVVSQ